MITYHSNIKIEGSKRVTHDVFDRGIIVPKNGSQIYNKFIYTLDEINPNSTLVLPSTHSVNSAVMELRFEEINITNPLFCLNTYVFQSWLREACELPKNITKDYVCEHEVVLSSENYQKNRLLNQSDERLEIFNKILWSWEKCKTEYQLYKKVEYTTLENINKTLYFYTKK